MRALAGFVLSVAVAAGALAPASAAPPLVTEMRLSEILGREVSSAHGRPIGPIRDLLIERASGRVQFVVVGEAEIHPVEALASAGGDAVTLEPPGEGAAGGTAAPAVARADLVRASELLAQPRVRDLLVDPLERTVRFMVLEDGVIAPLPPAATLRR